MSTPVQDIKFNYALKKELYRNEEVYNHLKRLSKENRDLRIADRMQANIDVELALFYNALVEACMQPTTYAERQRLQNWCDPNMPFHREYVHALVDQIRPGETGFVFLSVLVNSGVLGVSGSGYTFDTRYPIVCDQDRTDMARWLVEQGLGC